MSTSELDRKQAEILPKEDLTPYAGRWVALRDGHVVASDVDAVSLRNRPEVTEDDVIAPVPDAQAGIFIL
jgi:hypothetical protein